MSKLLSVTNTLLAVIAFCLVLIVAKIYDVSFVRSAHAAGVASPSPVYLVYYDGTQMKWLPVVPGSGIVPTSR